MSLERSLIVRGIPPNMTADHVQLLFESDRYCPDGGNVEKVEVATEKGTTSATVTFEDACGNYLDAYHFKLKLNELITN